MIVEDVIETWVYILIGLLISMFSCLILIAIMRWLATPLIWLSIVGVIVMLGFCKYFFTYFYFLDQIKSGPKWRWNEFRTGPFFQQKTTSPFKKTGPLKKLVQKNWSIKKLVYKKTGPFKKKLIQIRNFFKMLKLFIHFPFQSHITAPRGTST